MFNELIDTQVKIQFGVMSGVTDSVKGKVLKIENSWMKLEIKERIEMVNLEKVSRISVLD